MRNLRLAAMTLIVGSLAVIAAEKDTGAAANTRDKKLKVKVSVDFKEEMLSECLKTLSGFIEETGLNRMSVTYDTGVSQNQRVTFAAKDMAIEDVLDGMLKKNSLGYIVVSNAKDRQDGYLKITRGNERGWPKGQEPKDAKGKTNDAKSKDPKDVKKVGKGEKAPADAEKEAAGKLELANSLLKDGKTDKAKARFQEIVDKYPATKAAADAKKALEMLGM